MPSDKSFRIGVTGHRVPPKLPEASERPLRALIDRILADLQGTPRDLAIVSSLAEGSDRIVADSGLAAGCELEAVLPFKRGEYIRDFESKESREEFERLLGRASAVIELDGAANARPQAYEAAGLYMLGKISVLFAIWDGKAAAGVGGTEEIVGRAIAGKILVVWIDPTNPDAIRVSLAGADDSSPAATSLKDRFRIANSAGATLAINATRHQPVRQS